jgi:hypothetical protein
MFESCPSGATAPPEELLDVAVALLALGYRQRWPRHVRRAQQLLQV